MLQYYLVEELSACHEGVSIDVFDGVTYTISGSDGSHFLTVLSPADE